VKTTYRVGERVQIIGHSSKLAGYVDYRNPIGQTGTVVFTGQPWGTPENPGYTVEVQGGKRYALVASELQAQP